VGLIAQAGISSAIAFLDFLGVNGQNQSLSIITFNLTNDVPEPYALNGTAHKCNESVPVVYVPGPNDTEGSYTG
jgi:hypothetical protein